MKPWLAFLGLECIAKAGELLERIRKIKQTTPGSTDS